MQTILFSIVVGVFLLVCVGSFLLGYQDSKNTRRFARVSKPLNPGLSEDIYNSDGKPDLPFTDK